MSRVRKQVAVATLAVAVVGGFEGLRQSAYRDVVGIPTACYGETRGIRMGMKFTKTECNDMLLKRLDEFADGMEACTHVPLTDERYVALLSFSYNVGTAAYCHSSVARYLNEGKTKEACNALLAWDKAGGRQIAGLSKRRWDERELCLKGT